MADPLAGVDTSNDPYVIVSSDTHAGLQVEEYRDHLESKYHRQFDEWAAERHNHRRLMEETNGEYVERWERENRVGLQGAYDPEIRDKELDADGIAGEVIFADGDAVTGQESPPFGAGLAAGQITDPELAFAGASRAQPLVGRVLRDQPCAPCRCGAGADNARRCGIGTRDRIPRRQAGDQGDHDPDDVARQPLLWPPEV